MATDYTYLYEEYPEVISADQLYRICHISKRKAKWLLEHGYIPCEDSGKKTRRYKIRLNDVIDYPWLLAAGQHNAVHHRCCDLVLRAEKGTHPPSSGVPDANSRCLRAGASLRAGFPNCLLFGMAGFSADSCNWHIALLRHAAGIEHLLRW